MTHDPSLEAFIRGIPKAELHLHIEGTLEPELMFAIARRNGIALPWDSVDALRGAYDFHDLQSFLDIYYRGTDVLHHVQDFYDLTFAYFERAARDNVRHVELFFDPQTHTRRDVPFETVITGIHGAQVDAEKRLGISSKLILCFLRHLSPESALEALAPRCRSARGSAGSGSTARSAATRRASSRRCSTRPARRTSRWSRTRARRARASYIVEALDLLGAQRIDHGVRCVDDPALVERLIREQIPLTVCPLSNLKLRVFPQMAEHNLKDLLERGLMITINSDDPAYFGGYVGDNYTAAAQALGLSRDQVVALARNSFTASFLADERKAALIGEVDRFVAAQPGLISSSSSSTSAMLPAFGATRRSAASTRPRNSLR
jgi:adenosine deaminase